MSKSFTLVAAMLIAAGCAPTTKTTIKAAPVNESKPETPPVVPDSTDLTGHAISEDAKLDENTSKYVSSLAGVFVQENQLKSSKLFRVVILKTDGREIVYSGKLSAKSKETALEVSSDSALKDDVKTQSEDVFGQAKLGCLKTCDQLEIAIPVSVSKTQVVPVLKVILENNLDGTEVGVKKDVKSTLSQVISVRRAFAYIVGTNSGTITYNLRGENGGSILTASVAAKGASQTAKILYSSDEALKAAQFVGAANEVQMLNIVQGDGSIVPVALGFRTP